MSESRLIELSYFDPKSKVRLTAYADTIMVDRDNSTITAIRFGGYPEMVRAMSDAIYGGGTIEAVQNETKRDLKSAPKGYRRQLTHDGVYASATLIHTPYLRLNTELNIDPILVRNIHNINHGDSQSVLLVYGKGIPAAHRVSQGSGVDLLVLPDLCP